MKKIIKNHKNVAKLLEEASIYHQVAARLHEAGNDTKAEKRSLITLTA